MPPESGGNTQEQPERRYTAMAYTEKNPLPHENTAIKKHSAIALASCMVFVTLLAFSPYGQEFSVAALIVLFLIVFSLFMLAYFKMHPLLWTLIFRRAQYRRLLEMNALVVPELEKLDDSCFVFHNITIELFHVEHLVISPGGSFIMKKYAEEGDLRAVEGVLCCGGRPLDTLTAGLWRSCHLVSIMAEKAFHVEIMPRPVIVTAPGTRAPFSEFDGIIIAATGSLHELPASSGAKIKREIVESFAYYLKGRYIRG